MSRFTSVCYITLTRHTAAETSLFTSWLGWELSKLIGWFGNYNLWPACIRCTRDADLVKKFSARNIDFAHIHSDNEVISVITKHS